MNASALVDWLLEGAADDIDPRQYLRTAEPQQRLRFLKGERVVINARGWPYEKATVVTTPDNPDFVWIHVDGYEPGDNLYFRVDDLEPLATFRA